MLEGVSLQAQSCQLQSYETGSKQAAQRGQACLGQGDICAHAEAGKKAQCKSILYAMPTRSDLHSAPDWGYLLTSLCLRCMHALE